MLDSELGSFRWFSTFGLSAFEVSAFEVSAFEMSAFEMAPGDSRWLQIAP